MDRKVVVIVLICIIIIGVGVFVYDNNNLNSNNLFRVGSTDFKLPENYFVGSPNQFGAVNITDGEHSIFLVEYNDTNLTKHINEYQKFIKNKNQTIGVLNFTVDGISIHKTFNVDNPNNAHYWVLKNKKIYDIYKWDENPKMDYIVSELVKSSNSSS